VRLPAAALVVAEQLPDSDPQKKVLLDYKTKFEAKHGEVSIFGGHAYDGFAGVMLGLKGFAAAIPGGTGNSMGAVAAGLLFGVLESLGADLIPVIPPPANNTRPSLTMPRTCAINPNTTNATTRPATLFPPSISSAARQRAPLTVGIF